MNFLKPIESNVNDLIKKIRQLGNQERFILGIAGIPAAGKSTIAVALADHVNAVFERDIAVVVPMDGFHRYNKQLHELGLYSLKGVPDTFDSEKYINLLRKLKGITTETVYCPEYDRAESHDPIEDRIAVHPHHRLVITEGNYLLLDTPPWNQIRNILDRSWFLEAPRSVTKQHLIDRHLRNGLTLVEAEAKIASTDLPNSDLIDESKQNADEILLLDHKQD